MCLLYDALKPDTVAFQCCLPQSLSPGAPAGRWRRTSVLLCFISCVHFPLSMSPNIALTAAFHFLAT